MVSLSRSAPFGRSSTGDNSPRRFRSDSFTSFCNFSFFLFDGVVVTRLPVQYRRPVSTDLQEDGLADERLAGRDSPSRIISKVR